MLMRSCDHVVSLAGDYSVDLYFLSFLFRMILFWDQGRGISDWHNVGRAVAGIDGGVRCIGL